MFCVIAGPTEGSTHRVRRYQSPGNIHSSKRRSERRDCDNYRWYSAILEDTREVSHGHVTYGSQGYEDKRLDTLFGKSIAPGRSRFVLHPHLRAGADK